MFLTVLEVRSKMSFLGEDEMSDAGRTTIDVFAIIGMVAVGVLVLKLLWNIAAFIWCHSISKLCPTNLKKYGEWAVVTGSTDGIGKCYAHELAKRGFNIVLISRTLQKLEKVAQEIRFEHKVQTDIIQADFSDGRQIYASISQQLENKDIGILVNNVGVLARLRLFGKLTENEIWNEILVNVASVPAMTRIVLPGMLKRKHGLIVNIASASALHPLPCFQVYAATKSFVRNFSIALEYEYQGTGVDVQTVLPSFVGTNMTAWNEHFTKPGLTIPSPQLFVRHAVSSIGYAKETSGYWNHDIQLMMLKVLPQRMAMWSIQVLTNMKMIGA